MRTKTLLLITMLTAYGYYLHALSGAAQHHVDALRGQYNAALSSIGQQQVYNICEQPSCSVYSTNQQIGGIHMTKSILMKIIEGEEPAEVF